MNQEIVDTNKALTLLARNIDKKRQETEARFARHVSSKIIPVIEALKNDKISPKHQIELDVILTSLKEITPGLNQNSGILFNLSPSELRIATMIKEGLTSPEIARLLNISLDTVKSHRRSIRKKLNINKSHINLISYLRAKMN